MVHCESDRVTTLPLKCTTFSEANCATLLDPDTVTIFPLKVSPHVLSGEVYKTVAGTFRSEQTSTKAERLSRQNPGELVTYFLVLAKQLTNFSCSHANVPSRDIRILADVPLELRHERLAETHHFVVGLTLGVIIRSPFSTPQR